MEFIASELFRIPFSDDAFTNSLILTLQREFYPMEAGSKIRLDNEDHMSYPKLNPNRKSISCYRIENPFQAVFRKKMAFGHETRCKGDTSRMWDSRRDRKVKVGGKRSTEPSCNSDLIFIILLEALQMFRCA